jgi:hypothetical protein
MRNRAQNRLEILGQLRIPEPFDAKAFAIQKSRAPLVDRHVFRSTVLVSVEFDHQPGLEAHEVGDVRTDWLLTSELESTEPAVTKRVPKFAFHVGLVATKLAGKVVLHLFPLTSKI